MKEKLLAIAVLFTALFFERFPEEDDQSNPYMLVRLLVPLLKDTRWECEIKGKCVVLTHPWNY